MSHPPFHQHEADQREGRDRERNRRRRPHGVAARQTVGGGLLLIGTGSFCRAVLGAGSDWTAPAPGLVLVGVGIGLVAPGVAGAALAAVPAMEVPPRERSRAWGRAAWRAVP